MPFLFNSLRSIYLTSVSSIAARLVLADDAYRYTRTNFDGGQDSTLHAYT
jgi:hypothetical protein